jgi:hypothetical protein
MTRKSTILLLAAPLFAAVPASAQTYAGWKSGFWSVDSRSGECWMRAKDRSGGEISVGVSAADPDFFVSAVQPGWSRVKAGTLYPVRVRFGAVDRETTGLGLRTPSTGIGVAFRQTANADSVELFKAESLTVIFDGDSYTVDLDRTALSEFRRCIIAIGGVGW